MQKYQKWLLTMYLDRHLNVFNAYSSGDLSNYDNVKILENNLTRAFIITVQNLTYPDRREFLSWLLTPISVNDDDSRHVEYDLQNADKNKLADIQGAKDKVLLTISRTKSSVTKNELDHYGSKVLREIDGLSDTDKEQIKNSIRQHLKKHNGKSVKPPLDILERTYQYDVLYSIHEILTGSRPDAWIWVSPRFSVLVEAKISVNTQTEPQLIRHLTDTKGLGIDPMKLKHPGAYHLINTTWEEIGKQLNDISPNNVFTKEFWRYIYMADQILDLGFLVSKGVYDKEKMRSQFPLFLELLDKKLDSKLNEAGQPNLLIREGRPLYELWDKYSVRNNYGDKCNEPHVSVGFSDHSTDIQLTIRPQKTMVKRLLKSESFRSVVNHLINENDNELARYFFYLVRTQFVDRKKGQQRGEQETAMRMEMTLAYLKEHNALSKLMDEIIPNFLQRDHQFGFGYKVDYYDHSRKTKKYGLKAENKQLLETPDLLADKYAEFVSMMIPCILDIRK